MRVYDNESKSYPELNPTATQEPRTYRLNKLSKIKAYFRNEIDVCEQKRNDSIQSQV